MADSDNSTTLSFVTRRKILMGASIAIGALGFDAFANDAIEIDGSSDPVLALWRQWHDAHVLMENHGCRTQSLEQQLAETVDYPCAKIELPDGKSVTAYSLTAIRDIFDGAPGDAADRTRAEAAFAEHQLRWDEADQKIGYSARVKAEHVAADQAANILEVMATTSSTTLAGIEAKLDATLREGTVWEDCSEFPWPQIRSALNDIIRIKQHQASGAPS